MSDINQPFINYEEQLSDVHEMDTTVTNRRASQEVEINPLEELNEISSLSEIQQFKTESKKDIDFVEFIKNITMFIVHKWYAFAFFIFYMMFAFGVLYTDWKAQQFDVTYKVCSLHR